MTPASVAVVQFLSICLAFSRAETLQRRDAVDEHKMAKFVMQGLGQEVANTSVLTTSSIFPTLSTANSSTSSLATPSISRSTLPSPPTFGAPHSLFSPSLTSTGQSTRQASTSSSDFLTSSTSTISTGQSVSSDTVTSTQHTTLPTNVMPVFPGYTGSMTAITGATDRPDPMITAGPLPPGYPSGTGVAATQFGYYGNATFRTDCYCSDWVCYGSCTSYSSQCSEMWFGYNYTNTVFQRSMQAKSGTNLITAYETTTLSASTFYSLETTVKTVGTAVGTYVLNSSPTSTRLASTIVSTTVTASQYPYSVPTPHCAVSCPYPSIVPTSNGCAECTIYGVTIQPTKSANSTALPTSPLNATTTSPPNSENPPNVNARDVNVTPAPASPVTAVVDGVTITSPDVAMSFRSAYAINICGKTVGSVLGHTVLTLAPTDVSSYRMSYNPLATTNGNPGLATVYPKWSSKAWHTGVITVGGSVFTVNIPENPQAQPSQVLPVNFADFDWPYDPVVWNQQIRCIMNPSSCQYIASDEFNPVLQIPTQVRNFEPSWSTCSLDWEGVFDPPSALTQQTAIPDPTIPAAFNEPATAPATPTIASADNSSPTALPDVESPHTAQDPKTPPAAPQHTDAPPAGETGGGQPTHGDGVPHTTIPSNSGPTDPSPPQGPIQGTTQNPSQNDPPIIITTHTGHTKAIFTAGSSTITVNNPKVVSVTTAGRTELIIPSGTNTFTISIPSHDPSVPQPDPIRFVTSPGRTEAVYTSGTMTFTVTNPTDILQVPVSPQPSFSTLGFNSIITTSDRREVIFTAGSETITLTERPGATVDPIRVLTASGETRLVYKSGSETYTSIVHAATPATVLSVLTVSGKTEEIFKVGSATVTVVQPSGETFVPISIHTTSGLREIVMSAGPELFTVTETLTSKETAPSTTTHSTSDQGITASSISSVQTPVAAAPKTLSAGTSFKSKCSVASGFTIAISSLVIGCLLI